MAKQSSQKFIARNRAPTVQIEYDIEIYGAQKKVQIPVRHGRDVRSVRRQCRRPAAGRRAQGTRDRRRQLRQPPAGDEAAGRLQRAEHADRRRQPRGGHHLREPGRLLARRRSHARSRRWPSCSRHARSWPNLGTYLDGKAGAEKLIAQAIKDPALLQALVSAPARRRRLRQGVIPIMATQKTVDNVNVAQATRPSDFAALLTREFKPKSERAGEEVRVRRAHAGRAGAEQVGHRLRRRHPDDQRLRR